MSQAMMVLLVQPDPQAGAEIKARLVEKGFHEVELVASCIEAIGCFESSRPGLVILQAAMEDMPIHVVVGALRQLDESVPLYLTDRHVSAGLRAEAGALGVSGVLPWELGHEDLSELVGEVDISRDFGDFDDDETVHGWVTRSGLSSLEEDVDASEIVILDGAEVRRLGTYQHHGSLRVRGDLVGVKRLDVSGSLVVDGDIKESYVTCKGDLHVTGGVKHCKNLGVFCRSTMVSRWIEDSLIVVAGSLVVGQHCKNSVVNVGVRMVGVTKTSLLSGGIVRVGEHLSMGRLGETTGRETRIELAASLFFPAWISRWRSMVKAAAVSENPLTAETAAEVENRVNQRQSFFSMGDMVVGRIAPGVSIRVGDFEEFVASKRKGPFRVRLSMEDGGSAGIVFTPRKAPVTINPQGLENNGEAWSGSRKNWPGAPNNV